MPGEPLDATWNGHRITVDACALARTAWLTSSINVHLDDRAILESGGQFHFSSFCTQTFEQDDGEHSVELFWGSSFWASSFPISVRIDDQTVLTGRVKVSRWYFIWIWMLAAIVLLVLVRQF